MDSKGWADRAIADLKRVAAAAKAVGAPPQQGATDAAQATRLDPQVVGAALAELLKSDNSLTQSISVRIANLSAKYPNKAF